MDASRTTPDSAPIFKLYPSFLMLLFLIIILRYLSEFLSQGKISKLDIGYKNYLKMFAMLTSLSEFSIIIIPFIFLR